MIRIHFANLNQILTFDGEVLEVFYGTKSARAHIGHIKGAEIFTDRKGNQELRVNTLFGPIPYMPFEPQLAGKVNALVTEIQKAITSFAL